MKTIKILALSLVSAFTFAACTTKSTGGYKIHESLDGKPHSSHFSAYGGDGDVRKIADDFEKKYTDEGYTLSNITINRASATAEQPDAKKNYPIYPVVSVSADAAKDGSTFKITATVLSKSQWTVDYSVEAKSGGNQPGVKTAI